MIQSLLERELTEEEKEEINKTLKKEINKALYKLKQFPLDEYVTSVKRLARAFELHKDPECM